MSNKEVKLFEIPLVENFIGEVVGGHDGKPNRRDEELSRDDTTPLPIEGRENGHVLVDN